MVRTQLSARYQVTIPREMREGLHPGEFVNVVRNYNIIVIVPERPISEYRGILKGVSTTGFREKNDRKF